MNLFEDSPNDLKVAVWDTYIKKRNGSVMHFDIIVPENFNNQEEIFKYGEDFVKSKGENEVTLDAAQCQFCHIEDVTTEVRDAIADNGHYILAMDDIPRDLPENPNKRDLVFHLKGHYKELRFANFSGVAIADLHKMISSKEGMYNFSEK
jgi:hypothetical protein